MRIILARHGRTLANVQGMILGRGDSPLTRQGRAEMVELARMAAGFEPGRLYSSSLGRGVESARILGLELGLVPIPDQGLDELGCGEWEGSPRLNLLPAGGALRPDWNFSPPGGESCLQAEGRVLTSLERIRAECVDDRPALIMGHAGINRVVLRLLTGSPPERLLAWTQPHASLVLVQDGDVRQADKSGAIRPGFD